MKKKTKTAARPRIYSHSFLALEHGGFHPWANYPEGSRTYLHKVQNGLPRTRLPRTRAERALVQEVTFGDSPMIDGTPCTKEQMARFMSACAQDDDAYERAGREPRTRKEHA
jgi:hypothetical protein